MEPAAAEAAQIAHADHANNQPSDNGREKAIADLALITGAPKTAITVDPDRHLLRAPAAPLLGLSMAGYRAIEQRANQVLNGWSAEITPPDDAGLPTIEIREGIIDDDVLNLAVWASTRVAQGLSVVGGSLSQRKAVAISISKRGGHADVGVATGKLRLTIPDAAKDTA